VQGEQRRTWREFDERAGRLAAALRDLGLGPDSKVAFYLYNCNEYLEALLACFKLRAVPANVNYRYTADELAYLLDNSDAETLVFHGSLGERVDAVRDPKLKVRAVVQVDDGSPLVDGALRYEDLVAAHDPMERIERSGDDLVFLYTGGTTGMPKAVVWRHEDLFAALAPLAYAFFGLEMPEDSADAGALALMAGTVNRPPEVLVQLPRGGPLSLLTLYVVAVVTAAALLVVADVLFARASLVRPFTPPDLAPWVSRDAFGRPPVELYMALAATYHASVAT